MQNPTNGLSRQEQIAPLVATLTEVSNLKLANENGLNVNECQLEFREQCKIVWEGLKKGVRYDGCTGVPDFGFGTTCCGEHDAHYQLSDISRAEADSRLRRCMQKAGMVGYGLSWVYWLGVRALGWKFYRKKNET